jgi:hypothetical protein
VHAARGPDAPPALGHARVIVVHYRAVRAEVEALCDESPSPATAGRAVRADIVCHVGALAEPDLRAVDMLARFALVARRLGHRIRLQSASADLERLVALAGLDDVMPCESGLRIESIGQPEQGEEPLGVEEERDRSDPAAP